MLKVRLDFFLNPMGPLIACGKYPLPNLAYGLDFQYHHIRGSKTYQINESKAKIASNYNPYCHVITTSTE